MKLADLYRYESSRGGRVIDAVYYQNAHIILHEDATFRFESRPDGPFTMQLLDTDRSEVPAGMALFLVVNSLCALIPRF